VPDRSRPAGGRPPAPAAAAEPDLHPPGTDGTRRALLGRLAAFAGVARLGALGGLVGAGGATLAGCRAAPAPPPPLLRVPLAALPPGGRLRVVYRGDPVELRRDGEGVAARSLLCTHQGCEVKWQGDRGRYHCPCHDGTYDGDGRPLGGAPTRPLAAVPARLEGDEVVVGAEERG
jgi:nitrite reductase/ring-hydroxylating ferredoxin subunit